MDKAMRRIGNLYTAFASFENLYKAARKAVKGSPGSFEALRFMFNLEHELLELERELTAGAYVPAPYSYFTIYEPKERNISVAPFRDRVVHHALVNVLEPVFERVFIFDSYATRKGKGTHAAVSRAQAFLRKNHWYLKCDISKYFPSVDIAILIDRIRKKIKDASILEVTERILRNGAPAGKGLPIGNLTSQFLANVYLDGFDHWMKETINARYYLRYMDDFVVFANAKDRLRQTLADVAAYLSTQLGLSLKEKACCLNSSLNGLGFLGRRIFPSLVRIKKENLKRTLGKIKRNEYLLRKGLIDESRYGRSMESLLGYVTSCDTLSLRRTLWGKRHKTGSNRVNRGGSWNNNADNLRSSNRDNNSPDNRNNNLGFRLVSTGAL
ncbi:MAG: reverse transcriptase domain-containing protein [Bacillota bacterium]